MVTPHHTFPNNSSWAKYLPVLPQPLVTPIKFNILKKNYISAFGCDRVGSNLHNSLELEKPVTTTTTTTCSEVIKTARTTRLCRTKILEKRYNYPPISKVQVTSLSFN